MSEGVRGRRRNLNNIYTCTTSIINAMRFGARCELEMAESSG